MDELLFARAQMGFSLIFHIVFSVLGMALPVLIVGVEWKSLRDPKGPWLALARTWSKAMAVLFVIGAVSGTALSMEFGLLWPTFMRQAGGVIGLPFALEGYAFALHGHATTLEALCRLLGIVLFVSLRGFPLFHSHPFLFSKFLVLRDVLFGPLPHPNIH